MPIGSASMFGVVLPVAKVNLLQTTSFERGTTGAVAIGGATLGSSSGFQQFGAWSLQLTPGANGTGGAAPGTWTAGLGTAYTVSAYARISNNNTWMIGVGDSAGVNLVGSTAITGGGTWQRYSYSFTEAAGAVRSVVIRKNGDASVALAYVDGVQAEAGSLTTYVDGDEDGCYWLGAPHASQSARSGTYRGGGSVVALADLGLRVDQALGIGMMPLENTAQSFALTDGAEYQHTRAKERPFTLTAYVGGTTQRDYHITRRTILNALKIDVVDPQQPLRLWYVGGEGTIAIDAVLDAGMEGQQKISQTGFGETAAIRFIAYDPYWHATTDEGTTLAARQTLGTSNYILKRDPIAGWGTLGAAGVTTTGKINALAIGTDGVVYLGGSFGAVGGTTYKHTGQYNPTVNLFGTLINGSANSFVNALVVNPQGSIFMGGSFTTLGGTLGPYIGFYCGSFGTIGSITGGPAFGVYCLAFNQTGTLFYGGDFVLANGTNAHNLGLWNGAAIGTLKGQAGGTVDGNTYALAVGLDNVLYFGGNTGAAGGTNVFSVAKWNGAFGSMGSGVDNTLQGMAVLPNGQIGLAGQFAYAGSQKSNAVAMWNGVQYQPMGSGLDTTVNAFGMLPFSDGRVLCYGAFTKSGALTFPDTQTIWNGYAFLPLDVNIQTVTSINAAALGKDNTLYIAGDFIGTAKAASVATLINTGMADAYPIIKMRLAATTGTCRIYQTQNNSIGASVYFNLTIQAGEELVLDTTPGARSFRSSFQGNVFGKITPGSNLSSLRMQPGTNYISFFADNDSLTTSIFWRSKSWSADGGTIT